MNTEIKTLNLDDLREYVKTCKTIIGNVKPVFLWTADDGESSYDFSKEITNLVDRLMSFFLYCDVPAEISCFASSRIISEEWLSTEYSKAISSNDLEDKTFNRLALRVANSYLAYREYLLYTNDTSKEIYADIESLVNELVAKRKKIFGKLEIFQKRADYILAQATYDLFGFRNLSEIHALCKNTNSETASAKEEVSKIKEDLKQLTTEITTISAQTGFVRLTGAFGNLLNTKKRQHKISLVVLAGIFVILILIPSCTRLFSDPKLSINEYFLRNWFVLPIEILFLYGFKLVYKNYMMIGAQITQLEIRIALCQFAKNYKEFVDSTFDKTPIEKLESLIFSGLSADLSDTPQVDGLDQIIKIAETFKPK